MMRKEVRRGIVPVEVVADALFSCVFTDLELDLVEAPSFNVVAAANDEGGRGGCGSGSGIASAKLGVG